MTSHRPSPAIDRMTDDDGRAGCPAPAIRAAGTCASTPGGDGASPSLDAGSDADAPIAPPTPPTPIATPVNAGASAPVNAGKRFWNTTTSYSGAGTSVG
jgi:hypothetical protein